MKWTEWLFVDFFLLLWKISFEGREQTFKKTAVKKHKLT